MDFHSKEANEGKNLFGKTLNFDAQSAALGVTCYFLHLCHVVFAPLGD